MTTTYKLISKQILATNSSSIIFSNIPQTYTDLVITFSAREQTGTDWSALLRLNGSSTAIYGSRVLQGQGGSGVISFSQTNSTSINFIVVNGSNSTANTFSNGEIYFTNYTSTTNKSISATSVSEDNGATAYIRCSAGSWSDNRAINSVEIFPSAVTNFATGSSFFLYGITRSDDNSPGTFGIQATGGDEVFIANGYKVHVFKSSGTFNVTSPGFVEYLVIAGGGGGGTYLLNNGVGYGGGGAGGYRSSVSGENSGGGTPSTPSFLLPGRSYPVIVGGGGPAENNGSDSSFNGIISLGGGRGHGDIIPAAVGGSGGGGYYNVPGASGTTGQGYGGGNGVFNGPNYGAGGGGGAGSAGTNGTTTVGGNGGNGVFSSITGSSVGRAGGGGGGTYNGGTAGTASSGGGAGRIGPGNGVAGTVNTGGGGGGAGSSASSGGGTGGNGGSGIVIIRYPVS